MRKKPEFDTVETVDAIAEGLRAGGHEVEKVEVTGPASHLAARIESIGPDLIFNTAEGRRGRAREAFYPGAVRGAGLSLYGLGRLRPDRHARQVADEAGAEKQGIDTPRARLVTPDDLRRMKEPGALGLAMPVIVKPNYEGSSKGIGDDAVVRDARTAGRHAAARAAQLPERRAGRGVRRRHRRDGPVSRRPRRRGRAAAGRLRRRAVGAEPVQPLRLPTQVGRFRSGLGPLSARSAA